MKLEVAKAIIEAAEEMGLDSVRLSENYSGRGMYGRMTAGVVADNWSDLLRCIALAAGRVAQDLADTGEEREDGLTLENFVEAMDLATDSMGRGLIVY